MFKLEITNPEDVPYVVYWIRRADKEYDITKDGYIGVSCQFSRRMNDHTGGQNGNPTVMELLKTEKLLVSIVFIGNHIECLDEERRLRPKRDIGWNISVGGYAPTQRRYDGTEAEKFRMIPSKEGYSKGMKIHSDETKIAIGNFHRGKVISAEQKAKMKITYERSIANGTNSVVKGITLEEYGSKKLYSFKSISEASRILSIHLSNLKSSVGRQRLNRIKNTNFRIRFDLSEVKRDKLGFNTTTTTFVQFEESKEIVDLTSPIELSGLYGLPSHRNSFTSRRAYKHYEFKEGWRLLSPNEAQVQKDSRLQEAMN